MSSLRRSRFLVAGALAVSLLSMIVAGRAMALPGDPLIDDVKARQEVEAQRIKRVVDDALQGATDLGRAKRWGDAVTVLQAALKQVDNSTALSDTLRDKYSRTLKRSIQDFDPKNDVRVTDIPVTRPVRPPLDDGRKPFDTATNTIQGRGTALADSRDITKQRGAGLLAASNSVYTSAIPPRDDYNFPSAEKWREISKRVSKNTMTDRERAILRELNKTRSVDYDGQTLEEVINQLSKSMGQTITLNKADLESVGASYETPVKLQMKNVATRSILKKILGELNLTYIMKDESIIVMTPERAKNTLTTRTYYVGDLITALQNPNLPPAYNQVAMIQQVNQLAIMIQQSYDPNSWQNNGGPGSITFDPISMSFVIRQTAEMHFLLGVGMR